jgi:hypothetical protein
LAGALAAVFAGAAVVLGAAVLAAVFDGAVTGVLAGAAVVFAVLVVLAAGAADLGPGMDDFVVLGAMVFVLGAVVFEVLGGACALAATARARIANVRDLMFSSPTS